MTRSKTFRGLLASVAAVALLVVTTPTSATEQKNQTRRVTNIVLVHGAWADGSSWSKVIPLLEARGLHVVAVQLPLTSLADDVTTVQRAITLQDGPLLLVGHSYGGVVITEAGNDPKVAGLVYVAAFAPLEGQSANDLAIANPAPGLQELRQDQFGFMTLTPKGIRQDFAQDLSDAEQAVLTATQSPTAGASLGAPVSTAAWRNRPAWYVIAARDRIIAPTLQETLAQQMNATSITLASSHVAMLSKPYEVSSFIRKAAREDR
jgi:pimeloyl-ACP methyl ester carboxylesterase